MVQRSSCVGILASELDQPSSRDDMQAKIRHLVVRYSQEDSRAAGDYVIVHELLHFSVPHHGKLWKSLMRAHLGDYEKLDRKLKRFATRGNLHMPSGEA